MGSDEFLYINYRGRKIILTRMDGMFEMLDFKRVKFRLVEIKICFC